MHTTEDLPPKLRELAIEADHWCHEIRSAYDWTGAIVTMEMFLRERLVTEKDRPTKEKMLNTLQGFFHYYGRSSSIAKDTCTQIVVSEDPHTQEICLSLFPPRLRGSKIDVGEVYQALDIQGARFDLDYDRIQQAFDLVHRKGETIWKLPVGRKVLAQEEEGSTANQGELTFVKRPFRKNELFPDGRWDTENPFGLVDMVEPGDEVAHNLPLHNPLLEGTLEGLEIKDTKLVATQSGVLVQNERGLTIMPLYRALDGLSSDSNNIEFHGIVYIKGNIKGPISIKAEELYIEGAVEKVNLEVFGDCFISGPVYGKNKTQISTEGKLYAKSLANCKVRASQEIQVRDAATYTDLVTNHSISVISSQGQIVGGMLQALRGIEAPHIGSDFGTYTQIQVGKDYLSNSRLDEIKKDMNRHAENISKIKGLKDKLAKSKITVDKLPQDKQDLYFTVLEKEKQSLQKLRSLERRKKRYEENMREFLGATVQVLATLKPPVEVQIGEIAEEIQRNLENVVFRLDENNQLAIDSLEG